jgi:hypothetical protein
MRQPTVLRAPQSRAEAPSSSLPTPRLAPPPPWAALCALAVGLAAAAPALGQADAADAGAEEDRAGDGRPCNSCGDTPIPAPAPVNYRVTETFIAEYVGDNGVTNESNYGDDDNFWIFKNIVYGQAGNKHFDSGLRLDLSLFQNPPGRVDRDEFLPGGSGYTTLDYGNDFRLERIYGTANLDRLRITAGDFYVSFGRGIALSLVKLDDVGEDTALRGARVEYQVPRALRLTMVAGVVNTLNVDPITKQIFEDDPMDSIVGARAEWQIQDALGLGVHGVMMRPRFDDEADINPNRLFVDQGPGIAVLTGGITADLHVGGLQLYMEGNAQTHDNYRPIGAVASVTNERGYGVYGEISYDLSPFMVKGEGVFYRRWMMDGPPRNGAPVPYNNMPTLEPIWMPIKSLGNAEGGRLTGDLFIRRSKTQLVLSTAALFYEGGVMPTGLWQDHPPTLVVQPILKARQAFGESGVNASAEGGYRYETTDEPEEGKPDDGDLWFTAVDISVPITGPHSVEAKLELRRHELRVTEGSEYWVTLASLGYDISGVFGVAVVHEYSDQTVGMDLKMGDWTVPLPRHNYVWALFNYHPPKPLEDLTLRLLAGAQRGGIKCAGGICRMYPDSVGAKLEAVYRF